MEKKKQGMIVTSVLLVCLILVVIGISFAFFTYSRQGSKENTITTGVLTFIYDEKEAKGNGITLSNAFPMSDEAGKLQTGSNNVFDFQVIATTQGDPIYYEVIGEKGESSTLPENVVKLYLTTVIGTEETPVDNTLVNGQVATFDQLPISQIPEYEGDKTLYQGSVLENQTKYTQQFRLRMWLSDTATGVTNGEWNYNNKTFTIKIHVYASNEMLPEQTKPNYKDSSGANIPELVEGMIPVKYDGNKWVKADTSSEWYDYTKQEWANAVTVTEGTRSKYTNAASGTEVLMEDINTMWVWIPRYEYQYTNLGTQYAGGTQDQPGEIKVNFLSGTRNIPSDSANYKVHPAFTFGDKELTGLWYAKFETGGKLSTTCVNENCNISNIVIKPSVTSLRERTLSTLFYAARSMQMNANNPYGFRSTSGNVHMSKNSEWGAVAYLSQSKYGKYGNSDYNGTEKDVAINNCSNYITGIGGDTVSASSSSTTCTTNTYETSKGQSASTTGNITGVYDMSGGSWEYVMGNYNNIISHSRFSAMPESKYYDLYTTEDASTACNSGICYGHALSETSGWWYEGSSLYLDNYFSWVNRGGYYEYGAYAGVFCIGSHAAGGAYLDGSSRFTIAP